MAINILAFGIVKEIFGNSTVSIESPDVITVAELIATIKEKYPAISTLKSFTVAINGSYAIPGTVIKQNDEVAIIPPVSGG